MSNGAWRASKSPLHSGAFRRAVTRSRFPNHNPDARVAYVTAAMPMIVASAALLNGAPQETRKGAGCRSQEDVPVAEEPSIRRHGNGSGDGPGQER